MKIYGYEFSKEDVTKVINSLPRSFGHHNVEGKLKEMGVPVYIGVKYISSPLASRIIQKMAKQGRVKRIYGMGYNTIWELEVLV